MNTLTRNSVGAELGPHGYVICQLCKEEVKIISRETSQEYAFCLHCRPKIYLEDSMPSVPKPSQGKNEKKRGRRVKTIDKSVKAKRPAAGSSGGHYTELVAMAKAKPLTADEVRAECEKRGLSKKTGGNYVCYLNKAKLLAAAGGV